MLPVEGVPSRGAAGGRDPTSPERESDAAAKCGIGEV